jgi:hypothetical protein
MGPAIFQRLQLTILTTEIVHHYGNIRSKKQLENILGRRYSCCFTIPMLGTMQQKVFKKKLTIKYST